MQYIKNLADNYPKLNNPIDIDIVVEGGVFNGIYSTGALMLVKELEKRNYFKVHRISGSSVGSIMSFLYLCDRLDLLPNDFKKIRNCFKKTLTLKEIEKIIFNHTKSLTDKEYEIINNKLYIAYTKNGERKIRYNYKSKKEVGETILRSIHVPYLTSGTFYREKNGNNYLDGGMPFIFDNRDKSDRKILYLNNSALNSMFTVKKELNGHGRMLEGAIDAHNYLLHNRKGFLTSFIQNWSIFDYLILRLKQLVYFVMIFLSYYMEKYGKKMILPLIKDLDIYKQLKSFLIEVVRDVVLLKCL